MNSDPIVVLGALVTDGRPARILHARLSATLSLWQRNSFAPLVVTGFGEAHAVASWLISHGVPAEAITLELEARSTNENLENSRALFPLASRLVVVTNTFHVPRTRLWAWHLGIPVQIVNAPTPPRSRVKNYLREVVALPHSAARIVWRRLVWFVRGR